MNNDEKDSKNVPSENRRSFWPMNPSTTHHNWFGYGMAALIFATAFANMFLGGRIKNVMKAEMPKASSWKNHQNFRESSESFANGSSRQYQQQAHSQQARNHNESHHHSSHYQDPKTTLLEGLAALHATHLRTLGLKPADYSEKAIKTAYRQLVLVYHPDRIALEDPQREEYLKKFQAISHSYQILMDSFQKSRS